MQRKKNSSERIGYRFLPDVAIADVCFEATGKDLNELFANAGRATTEIMVAGSSLRGALRREIQVTAPSVEQLLFDFLNELIYLKDTASFLVKGFEITVESNSEWKIHGTLIGDTIDASTQKMGADAKAITMHMFEVKQTDAGWMCRVVVDI